MDFFKIRELKQLEDLIESGKCTFSQFQKYLSMKETKIDFSNQSQESFYSVFGDRNDSFRSKRMKKLDKYVESQRVFKKRNL